MVHRYEIEWRMKQKAATSTEWIQKIVWPKCGAKLVCLFKINQVLLLLDACLACFFVSSSDENAEALWRFFVFFFFASRFLLWSWVDRCGMPLDTLCFSNQHSSVESWKSMMQEITMLSNDAFFCVNAYYSFVMNVCLLFIWWKRTRIRLLSLLSNCRFGSWFYGTIFFFLVVHLLSFCWVSNAKRLLCLISIHFVMFHIHGMHGDWFMEERKKYYYDYCVLFFRLRSNTKKWREREIGGEREKKLSHTHTHTNENTNRGDTFFDKAHGNSNTFVQCTRDDWLRKNGFQQIEQKNDGEKLFV